MSLWGQLMAGQGDRSGAGSDISALLHGWRDGDAAARDRLIAAVYHELRRQAAAHLRRERAQQTLQPTALVHEVYLRLVRQNRADWRDRRQFFAVAGQIMRRILVDRARARKMAKRSGRWTRVTLDDRLAAAVPDVDLLDLDRALSELAAFDARKSRIAELRFFAGLSLAETGQVVDLSVATIEREWRAARAWLYSRLTAGADG
jgi:RNA polymerase sigma factor (TIGR02999 family)